MFAFVVYGTEERHAVFGKPVQCYPRDDPDVSSIYLSTLQLWRSREPRSREPPLDGRRRLEKIAKRRMASLASRPCASSEAPSNGTKPATTGRRSRRNAAALASEATRVLAIAHKVQMGQSLRRRIMIGSIFAFVWTSSAATFVVAMKMVLTGEDH